jgi:hypothetical protein
LSVSSPTDGISTISFRRRWTTLTLRNRRAAHLGAAQDLQRRIGEYRPLAIVCLLKSIGAIVRAVASRAGFDSPFFEVPFPDNGQQRRFHLQMIDIVPELPREPF